SPEIMGLGPVGASLQALDRAGMTIDDIDLVEINEAFAAQVIPSYRELGIDINKLNVNGGAIAVGHPFGMTGARINSTLLKSLESGPAFLRCEERAHWLSDEHGLSHGYARAIVHEYERQRRIRLNYA